MSNTSNRNSGAMLNAGAVVLLATLVSPPVVRAEPLPVLLVIPNQDFYYREYAAVRDALAARGLRVVVAAGRKSDAIPQATSSPRGIVRPDFALGTVSAADCSAVVFVGGWGASTISTRIRAPTSQRPTGPTRTSPTPSTGSSTISSFRTNPWLRCRTA